jgi:hypothetical protein
MVDGNALETEKAFGAAMAEKLSTKLDAMRVNVAQSMFASQEPAEQNIEAEQETN